MTEKVRPPCVRGCTRPVLDDAGNRTQEPRPATEGLICVRCAGQLRDWLREIVELYGTLDTRPGSSGAPFAPGKRHKISGSPALARLDVIVLQDWRTTTRTRPTEDQPGGAHEDGDEKGVEASIPETFIDIACDLAKTLKIKTRPNTLTDAVKLLTGPWFTNVCYLDWIEDLYQIVKDMRRILRHANNLRDPKPLGRCNCGQMLYEPEPVHDKLKIDPEKAVLECRKCGHRMNALALTRLEGAQRLSRESG